MAEAPVIWQEEVGLAPYTVTVYERAEKKGVLYLRWRHQGNWRKESLRQTLRTADGRIIAERRKWALARAREKYDRLAAGTADAVPVVATPLTIAEGLARAIDKQTGKYPSDTPHRREVIASMNHAIRAWGGDTAWEAIRKADLRKLWRARLEALKVKKFSGARAAEVTVARILAVAAWLRDEELIPAGACVAPRTWKRELRDDWQLVNGQSGAPEPSRPRHALEEMRRILAVAPEVDPRFDLLMALGAELRLGQVRRARRSDLNIETWTFRVRSNKHKRGTVVELTPGQVRAVGRALDPDTGYLRDLERAAADYPLFPAGQLPGGRSGRGVATVARHLDVEPVDRTAVRHWFHAAEVLAKVPEMKGRGAYGVRRAAVDAVKQLGISREGLKAHGGWTDTQMPDAVYAEQDAQYAREEARDLRAKLRGEEDGQDAPASALPVDEPKEIS